MRPTEVVQRGESKQRRGALIAPLAFALAAIALTLQPASAMPVATTRTDFEMPGTQPLSIVDNFAPPSECTPCHSGYGQPEVEPFLNWSGSMMAQAGRDPLWRAALSVANQDATASGETCLRCHMPKGWLEGRSVPEDGTAMTADDREGVQCSICHRLVDPFADAENPPEDAAILAALADPVPAFGGAMMVVDPLARMRGPFDIIADLGSDPHIPDRTTIMSEFHESSDLCGTCHNLRNPVFTRDGLGNFVPNPLDTPADPTLGFPEQSTFDEWAASEYAAVGVDAPQFGHGHGGDLVSSCQDCHMPHVEGKDASTGLTRDNVPLHTFEGANTFIPTVLPNHPAFGSEVDADVMANSVQVATKNLRKAATVSMSLNAGNLTVTVTNETGHKLPTGYPEGRRMWLHVRAFDADRNVIFESGRYVFATADLVGYEALPLDPDYDPYLHVWETIHGISPDWALILGVAPGPSFNLVLNNVIEFDNRIPPRGFNNAAFEAFDAEPVGVGVSYADGQYWDDVIYPVGAQAVQAEATLYYQTASKEYIEFLRDENTTTASGNILFDLWNDNGKSEPVVMAHGFLETDASVVNRCHKGISKSHTRYQKKYSREWAKCFASESKGLTCNDTRRDERIAKAETKLRERIGGAKDSKCSGVNLTPITLGHGNVCPEPCNETILFGMTDMADCAVCMAGHLSNDTLDAAYGTEPPALPPSVSGDPAKCQKLISKASIKLAASWAKALAACEDDNRTGVNNPAEDCSTDPDGDIAAATAKAANKISKCVDFTGLAGCAAAGTAMDVQTCIEAAIGATASIFTEVAYP